MDSLTATKVEALAVTFVLAFTAGMLPVKLRKLLLKKSFNEACTKKVLSASLCFGAGVLMSVVLLHILKETRENFTTFFEEQHLDVDYPIAELVLCLGFFLIYFIEELVHLFIKYRHSEEEDSEPMGICHLKRSSIPSQSFRSVVDEFSSSKPDVKDGDIEIDDEIKENNNLELPQHELKPQKPQQMQAHCCCSMSTPVENTRNGSISQPHQSHNVLPNNSSDLDSMALVRSIFIILALSVHGAFEGMSLGLENTKNNVWLLCIALSTHKVFIGFSIGMELLEEGIATTLYVLHICIFSVASPIGGVIGALLKSYVQNTSEAGQLTIATLQGISGGTILYVTFCEILERERTKCKGRFVRLISLFAGFTIMAVVQAVSADHDHDHGHAEEAEHFHYGESEDFHNDGPNITMII